MTKSVTSPIIASGEKPIGTERWNGRGEENKINTEVWGIAQKQEGLLSCKTATTLGLY